MGRRKTEDAGEYLASQLDKATTKAEEIVILRKARWTYKQIKQGLDTSMWSIHKTLRQKEAA